MTKEFKKLEREYFNSFVERFPEYGSFLGLNKYFGKWSNLSRKKCLEDIIFFKRYLEKFKKINSKKLTKKENLEREIAIYQLKLWLFYFEKLKLWESDPDILEGIGSTLFVLLNRGEISFKKRILILNKSLENLSPLFEQIKTRLSKPYKLWTEIAIESSEGLKFFLENLKTLKVEKNLKEKFLNNIENSIEAVKNYKNFLKKEVLQKAIDKYIIGEKKFQELIKLRELNLKMNEILEIGERALKANKKELSEITKEIDPKLSSKELREKIEKEYQENPQEIIKQYQRIVLKVKKFILNHNLMKIPKNEKVIVKETPSFLAPTTPFAAYFSPPKFGKEKIGIYIITLSAKKKLLKKHNFTSIFNTTVHEAYPGHHLQSVLAAKNPSLIKVLGEAPEMTEGWAHYCEEYMRDVGFNNRVEIRFIQTLEEIWRAARVIIDIKLHCGKINFKEAVNFLIRETGMEREDALVEVKRYTKTPSYQLSYLIGKYLIKKLKREVQEKMGEKYSDKFFHEIILDAGSIPIKYLKEEFNLKIKNF